MHTLTFVQSPPRARAANNASVFTFDTMQKLFDLKQRNQALESSKDMPGFQNVLQKPPTLLDIPAAGGETSKFYQVISAASNVHVNALALFATRAEISVLEAHIGSL